MYSPESVLTLILSPMRTKAGSVTVTPALDAAPHSARGAQFACMALRALPQRARAGPKPTGAKPD